MKANSSSIKRLLIGLGPLVLVVLSLMTGQQLGRETPAAVALEPPALLDDDTFRSDAVGQKIQDEAGIAGYVKTTYPINLSLIRGEFRTIEIETADYIIGSVPVGGYYEHFDPHVYVHKDGWILAYYLKNEPAAKIVHQAGRTLDTNKFKLVIDNLAALSGSTAPTITYYDFRFPNANRLLIVSEDGDAGRDFYITLPVDHTYSELSYATDKRAITVDSNSVGMLYHDGDNENNAYGVLTLAQLSPGLRHNIAIPDSYYSDNRSYFGALVIIYRVP